MHGSSALGKYHQHRIATGGGVIGVAVTPQHTPHLYAGCVIHLG